MARTTVEAQLAKIRKARAELEKKEQALLDKSQDKIIARIVQLMTDNGIRPAQIEDAFKSGKTKSPAAKASSSGNRSSSKPARSTKGKKVPPKYRNPANPDNVWTGRGNPPHWVRELQENGTLESARILPAPASAESVAEAAAESTAEA